jgi:hypothetical protein
MIEIPPWVLRSILAITVLGSLLVLVLVADFCMAATRKEFNSGRRSQQ